MSVSGKRGVGIPVILLHDAEGGIVTIELKNGFTYRGILDEAQDNMNCTMKVIAISPHLASILSTVSMFVSFCCTSQQPKHWKYGFVLHFDVPCIIIDVYLSFLLCNGNL